MIRKKRRNTKQRRIILEELKKLKTHPTADHLYRLLRKRVPKISLGTVYRNLELLESDGLILKLNSVSNQSRFDGNPEPHYHIHCKVCDRVDDADDPGKDIRLEDIKQLNGYEIQAYKIDFIGICSQCK